MKAINESTLKEWGIDNLGSCVEIRTIVDEGAVIVCNKKSIAIAVDKSVKDNSITVGLYQVTKEIDKSLDTDIIKIEEGVSVADVDVCTSEATVFLTNDKKVTFTILRDEKLIGSDDYYTTNLGVVVEYK